MRATLKKTGDDVVGGLGRTRADGTCELDVRHGTHHVRVGKKKAFVHTGKPVNEVQLKLRSAPAVEPAFGHIEIAVNEPDPIARIAVALASTANPHQPLFERYLDGASKAGFEVPAGSYVADYAGRTVALSVAAGEDAFATIG